MLSVAELIGAMGLKSPSDLRPWHIMRRVSPFEVKHYGEIYEYVEKNSLLAEVMPPSFSRATKMASADTFDAV